MTGLSRHAPAAGGGRHVACDLLDARSAQQLISRLAPQVVVHAQAMSDVDQCELDPAAARDQNVRTTAQLIEALANTGALLVYVSTDYVFDGTKGAPYRETDEPHPISVYGRTKRDAEQLALDYGHSVVVRPSTLFGPGRHNFCDHVVSQLSANKPVEAFSDQVTSPTSTEDAAEALADLILSLEDSRAGVGPRVYHVANAGGCSRSGFARRIAQLLDRPEELVVSIPMAQQRRPAQRPACSALTTDQLTHQIGRTLRPWDEALEAYLRQRHWLN